MLDGWSLCSRHDSLCCKDWQRSMAGEHKSFAYACIGDSLAMACARHHVPFTGSGRASRSGRRLHTPTRNNAEMCAEVLVFKSKAIGPCCTTQAQARGKGLATHSGGRSMVQTSCAAMSAHRSDPVHLFLGAAKLPPAAWLAVAPDPAQM